MTWRRMARESNGELGLTGTMAERPQAAACPSGPAIKMKPRSMLGNTVMSASRGPAKHLVELGAATKCPVDLQHGLECLRRLDRPASQVVGAEIVERLQDRRVAFRRIVHLDGMVVKDQLVFDDLDPAAVAQGNRLERCQPLAVELGAALALEVHEIRRSVGPMFNPGVMPRHANVLKVNVQTGNAADVKVGPFHLIDPFRPPAADQFECWAKRMRAAHDATFARKNEAVPHEPRTLPHTLLFIKHLSVLSGPTAIKGRRQKLRTRSDEFEHNGGLIALRLDSQV